MKIRVIWAMLLIMIAGAIAANYYWRRQKTLAPEPDPRSSAQAPMVEKQAEAAAVLEPAIRYPVEDIKSTEATASRPVIEMRLQESDPVMREGLAVLFDRKTIESLLRVDEIVRRVVATVDSLPRKTLPERSRPMLRTPGAFLTSGKDETLALDNGNFLRYGPAVKIVASVDSKKVVALYVRHYAAFQEAYRELGHSHGYFNDRVIEVIDHLLAAPAVSGPIMLEQPRVMFQFAEPELEARSAGQKILIRMGPENAARIKAKLRELRQALAAERPSA